MRALLSYCLVAWTLIAGPSCSAARDEPWTKVHEAIRAGLPKTAIAALEQITKEAKKDKAYAEAVRAVALRIRLEAGIQGEKPEEKVLRLQAEVEKQPEAMRPALEAILGHWYWQFFNANRWRFLQRTQMVGMNREVMTWDLPRILAEIDVHFSRALANEKSLQATPISAYDDLLDKGSVPDTYRPTLFDFLAHEALQFYVAGEQAGAAPEDAYVLGADSPIFAPITEFLEWKPDSADTTSPTLKAIRLYQKLLAFHRNDADKTALIDADLERLVFGRNKATGEEVDHGFKVALEHFVRNWSDHEISARALALWARLLLREGNRVEARRLVQRGFDAIPNSVGGAMCFNLIQEIEAKSATIRTERVWNEPLPSIRVTYRNITKVFFRAVSHEFEYCSESRSWGACVETIEQQLQLLSQQPVLEWSADLPATLDYRERQVDLPVPRGLKPGFYFLVSSHDSSFGRVDNRISFVPIWVSDLALVVQAAAAGFVEGFVLQARTGEPVAGATVQAWAFNRAAGVEARPPEVTDADGYFRIRGAPALMMLLAKNGEDRVAMASGIWVDKVSEGSGHQTVFFTDRSLYRPGQSIRYKGIRIRFDPKRNDYQPLAGDEVTVVFSDRNGKEIDRAVHVCNDYGSFEGTFTAPRDRLMGDMRLTGPNGQISIRVEEYKRPKFQVELAAPAAGAKLDAVVVVPGKATAYSGAPIGAAKVRWRVVRGVRFPSWCWWRRGFEPGTQTGQAIAHGTAVTENDGSFTVRFTARPDRTVPERDEPVFEFQVHADVTDLSGETRSDEQSVHAGYTALQATLAAAEWQTPQQPVVMTIETRSLDGEPQAARGTLRVHRLQQPAHVVRAGLEGDRVQLLQALGDESEAPTDVSDPNSWELDAALAKRSFQTGKDGKRQVSIALAAGIYRAMLETQDRFGRPVSARLLLHVVDPRARRFPVRIANHLTAPKWSVEPGERFVALWGTGYDAGRACVEISHLGKVLRRYWTGAGRTQAVVQQNVGEELRGGFTLRLIYVRENRAYLNERVVDVPWSNKELTLKWERFRSQLGPGQKETWTAVLGGPGASRVAAEMVACLYDAALDQYLPHDWTHGFQVFRREFAWVRTWFVNYTVDFLGIFDSLQPRGFRPVDLRYPAFLPEFVGSLPVSTITVTSEAHGNSAVLGGELHVRGGRSGQADVRLSGREAYQIGLPPSMATSETPAATMPHPDLGKVTARKNLEETAFFFPRLQCDSTGAVRMEFTVPEALTEWKFLGFAHDRELRSGYLSARAVTAKDLMVEPNPPRFVREGDVIEFPVKVTNQTAEAQKGRVELVLTNARSLESMDQALGNTRTQVDFDVPGHQSRSYSWRLSVPDGCGFLAYKAVGATAGLSDGEEGYLPVLSRRLLVTESLPLPIRGKKTQQFQLAGLLESGASTTLRHQSLTVQMVSQPAWYAVMALPYLMEFPYGCSEQIFNRLYANSLARHIVESDPKIRRVFEQWKGTPALDSPLEKNEDLKAVLLEETPWYRQARAESEARRNVGILFDADRLAEETKSALQQLANQQARDGWWPWFPGGNSDAYISLYITTGFGRLRQLGAAADVSLALKAIDALDRWLDERYRDVLRLGQRDNNNLTPMIALYFYGRSFYLNDRQVGAEQREAVDYWQDQARKYWLALGNRQSQAHLAIGLQRFGDPKTPMAILRSLEERSVHDPELGMFWRDLEASWWWYRAPIETQATMIEAFAEVAHDSAAVEECKVWLLKQKQVQGWKTTKATADAVYALLLRGEKMLASDALVEVALAGETLRPESIEAGTGFYERRLGPHEIRPELGRISVRKRDGGVSWGSAHWQYLEEAAKVRPYAGTPLELEKALFLKEATKRGPVLRPVTGPLAVGDELVVRIVLRTDRDMEYVHLQDQRGSGTEPVNVLSQYKFQDGLAYYESTRDVASHFFIDYLPKGVYVFEYATRIQHRGQYETGVASIQCMYAPEFNSHSGSLAVNVR